MDVPIAKGCCVTWKPREALQLHAAVSITLVLSERGCVLNQ